MKMRSPYALLLSFLTCLFALRVLGQLTVVLFQPHWLPPMEEWYSGLMPYKFLLPIQALILTFMTTIDWQVFKGRGIFARMNPTLGRGVIYFSVFYFGAMVLRYAWSMTAHPERRWLGGTIPIVFHWVLAGFLFLYGKYQLAGRQS